MHYLPNLLQKPTKRGWNSKSTHAWLDMQQQISRFWNRIDPTSLKIFILLSLVNMKFFSFSNVFQFIERKVEQ